MVSEIGDRRSIGLPSGDVLIAGGIDDMGLPSPEAEIYRIFAGDFVPAPTGMNSPRAGHTMTLLPDGTVLIAGGGTSTAEIYDWTTPTFTPTAGNMAQARTGHTATMTAEGQVLIAGGENGGAAIGTSEVYNPISRAFTPGSPLNQARE